MRTAGCLEEAIPCQHAKLQILQYLGDTQPGALLSGQPQLLSPSPAGRQAVGKVEVRGEDVLLELVLNRPFAGQRVCQSPAADLKASTSLEVRKRALAQSVEEGFYRVVGQRLRAGRHEVTRVLSVIVAVLYIGPFAVVDRHREPCFRAPPWRSHIPWKVTRVPEYVPVAPTTTHWNSGVVSSASLTF